MSRDPCRYCTPLQPARFGKPWSKILRGGGPRCICLLAGLLSAQQRAISSCMKQDHARRPCQTGCHFFDFGSALKDSRDGQSVQGPGTNRSACQPFTEQQELRLKRGSIVQSAASCFVPLSQPDNQDRIKGPLFHGQALAGSPCIPAMNPLFHALSGAAANWSSRCHRYSRPSIA